MQWVVCVEMHEGCDSTSIGDVVAIATPGDTVSIAPGEYRESIVIDRDLRLTSTASTLLTADGTGAPAITVNDAVVTLERISLVGSTSRALEIVNSDVEVRSALIAGGGVVRDGGAVRAQGSALHLQDVDVVSGQALHYGGLIALFDSSMSTYATDFSFGRAEYGGAIALVTREGGALVFDLQGTLHDNHADVSGGAIALLSTNLSSDRAKARIIGSYFDDNTAGDSGGAIQSVLALSVIDSRFQRNIAAGSGGAIDLYWDGTLERSIFCENRADTGGALNGRSFGTQTWSNLVLLGNEATHDGGALSVAGTADISHAHIVGNRGPRAAAASLYPEQGAASVLRDSIVAANVADVDGIVFGNNGATVDHVSFWQNDGAPTGDGLTESASILADPLLSVETRCEWGWHPALPSWWGAGRDAGTDVDLDGTPGDLGAYAGPGAEGWDWEDGDGDGTVTLYDCAEVPTDDAAAFSVLAPEVWYDGTDQNCDGLSDYDADGDGFDHAPQGTDCDDGTPDVHPDLPEVPWNEVDENCDGILVVDFDGDGFNNLIDCDDHDGNVFPGAYDADPDADVDCDGYAHPTERLALAGCTTGPIPTGAPWMLLIALGAMRRKR